MQMSRLYGAVSSERAFICANVWNDSDRPQSEPLAKKATPSEAINMIVIRPVNLHGG